MVRAVRWAGDEELQIGVRSGGHSWAGNHVRDGGMLLDVSRLTDVEIDSETMSAKLQPGARGNELLAALAERELFFPAGHCEGVALGGYLLQGGYGWNGRVHGPACMSVEAIDLVTADGGSCTPRRRRTATCCGRHAAAGRASSASSRGFTFACSRARRS